MAHALYMPENKGYKHTLRIILIAFSRATMVTRTLLNVTLYVHCLFCKCISKFVLPAEIQQRIAFHKDTASTVQLFVKVTFSDYEAANTFVTLSLPTQFGADAASCRGQLKCDGTRAETRFRLSAKRTSPFKSAGESVQSTTGSRGVRISGRYGSNAEYTMFRGSVKSTGYPLHSPVSPLFPLPCVTACHHIFTGV
jgi:hypothetical protein